MQQKYHPQRGSSCTPACLLYAFSVATKTAEPICPAEVMECILSTAFEMYQKLMVPGVNFLQQHEVLESIHVPQNIVAKEKYATWDANFAREMNGDVEVVTVQEIFDIACDNLAVVITAGNNTTALVRATDDKSVYYFDPLGATVSMIETNKDFLTAVSSGHPGSDCMTLTVLSSRAVAGM